MNRLALLGMLSVLFACGDDGSGDTGVDASSTTSSDDTETSANATSAGPTTTQGASTTTTGDDGAETTSGSSSTTDGESTSSGSAGSSSTGADVFALSSPDFTDGELLPVNAHICEGNVHPALEWTNAPAGTMSFGVFFNDLSIDFDHSAIWDIPADSTGLRAGIEATAMPTDVPGALQCRHWGQTPQLDPFLGPGPRYGYGGPGSCSNTYQFTLFALDVAELPNVTSESTLGAVLTELEAHAIETVSISGQTQGGGCNGCPPE